MVEAWIPVVAEIEWTDWLALSMVSNCIFLYKEKRLYDNGSRK
jgi:hypothetical protein